QGSRVCNPQSAIRNSFDQPRVAPVGLVADIELIAVVHNQLNLFRSFDRHKDRAGLIVSCDRAAVEYHLAVGLDLDHAIAQRTRLPSNWTSRIPSTGISTVRSGMTASLTAVRLPPASRPPQIDPSRSRHIAGAARGWETPAAKTMAYVVSGRSCTSRLRHRNVP